MAVNFVTITKNETNIRLDKWFSIHYPHISFLQIQKKCRKGEIRLDGKRTKANARLETGMIVRIPPFSTISSNTTKNHTFYNKKDADFIKNLIIYKSHTLIALNKPYGISVQGGTSQKKHIDGLLQYLSSSKTDIPKLVHRLDKHTSGVLLLARSRNVASEIMSLFQHKKIKKIYCAIVVGTIHENNGTICVPLHKIKTPSGEKVIVDEDNGKKSITHFHVIERIGYLMTVVALYPKTGRTHQLRVHMAHLKTPILGDGKYGGTLSFPDFLPNIQKMHLHAFSLHIPANTALSLPKTSITATFSPHIAETFSELGISISEKKLNQLFLDIKTP